MEYVIARLEAGRDAAALRRHKGLHTGKAAKGWNAKKRYDDEGTWHAALYVARQGWDYAKLEAAQHYERMVFPERDFDPFNPNAPEFTMDDVIAARAEADRQALLATF